MTARPRGTPFAPGQSGNPGGKPRTADISALARRYTVDALRGLVAVARLPAEKHDTAVTAASRTLLEWGWPGHQRGGFEGGEAANVLHLHLLAVAAMPAPTPTAADLLGEETAADEFEIPDEMLPAAFTAPPEEALPLWDAAPPRRPATADAPLPAAPAEGPLGFVDDPPPPEDPPWSLPADVERPDK